MNDAVKKEDELRGGAPLSDKALALFRQYQYLSRAAKTAELKAETAKAEAWNAIYEDHPNFVGKSCIVNMETGIVKVQTKREAIKDSLLRTLPPKVREIAENDPNFDEMVTCLSGDCDHGDDDDDHKKTLH